MANTMPSLHASLTTGRATGQGISPRLFGAEPRAQPPGLRHATANRRIVPDPIHANVFEPRRLAYERASRSPHGGARMVSAFEDRCDEDFHGIHVPFVEER